jgi:hypothetical protein
LFFLLFAWFSKANDKDNAKCVIELKTAHIPYIQCPSAGLKTFLHEWISFWSDDPFFDVQRHASQVIVASRTREHRYCFLLCFGGAK